MKCGESRLKESGHITYEGKLRYLFYNMMIGINIYLWFIAPNFTLEESWHVISKDSTKKIFKLLKPDFILRLFDC